MNWYFTSLKTRNTGSKVLRNLCYFNVFLWLVKNFLKFTFRMIVGKHKKNFQIKTFTQRFSVGRGTA